MATSDITTFDLATEEWRDIPGYEGRYQVTVFGSVRSLARRNSRGRKVYARLLSVTLNKDGYLIVHLSKDGQRKGWGVHRLVMLAFVGERPGDLQVNHKDCNKLNNHVSNLEYCTLQENTRHARLHGLIPNCIGERNGRSKLDDERVRIVRRLAREGMTTTEIAKELNVSRYPIYGILHGRNWTHVLDEG